MSSIEARKPVGSCTSWASTPSEPVEVDIDGVLAAISTPSTVSEAERGRLTSSSGVCTR
jgi:hypothetical protein